jgi:hypothetical protein
MGEAWLNLLIDKLDGAEVRIHNSDVNGYMYAPYTYTFAAPGSTQQPIQGSQHGYNAARTYGTGLLRIICGS